MFPKISDLYLDIWTIGTYKLCCYPNCLVFGKPVFENFELKFEANSYLQIKEHHFFRYFQFFNKVLQINKTIKQVPNLAESSTSDQINKTSEQLSASEQLSTSEQLSISEQLEQNSTQVSTTVNELDYDKEDAIICLKDIDSNCVTYILNRNSTILIQSKYDTKLCFLLDLEELFQFFKGFYSLCFKVYCYPINIEECLFCFIRNETLSFLENVCETQIITFPVLGKPLSEREVAFLGNLLRRHHKLLLKIKCSMENFPNELDF